MTAETVGVFVVSRLSGDDWRCAAYDVPAARAAVVFGELVAILRPRTLRAQSVVTVELYAKRPDGNYEFLPVSRYAVELAGGNAVNLLTGKALPNE